MALNGAADPEAPIRESASREKPISLASLSAGRHGALWLGIFTAAACSLAWIHAWPHRYDIWSDGLSYLDMADALGRRDWATAMNGTWSPLYPLLVGLVLSVVRPAPAMEGPAVQALNFGILLAAAAAFGLLVCELQRYDAGRSLRPGESWRGGARWGTALVLISAVLFTQCAVEQFIRVEYVSPDLCVAAAFFLGTAMLVRILRKAASAGTYVALGAILGLGYLAKSIFFPLALLFLVAAFGAAGARSEALRGVALSIAAFALIAAAWILPLSLSRGRFTLGEAGRLNYAWYVNGVPAPPRFWQGGPEGAGTPVHPARLLATAPEVYDFDRPLRVTYPAWYDPSFWYEGVRLRFDGRRQAAVVAENARWYAHALAGIPAEGVPVMDATVVWALALLLYATGRGRAVWTEARPYLWLIFPAVGGLGLYGLIQLQGRYVGAMIAVLFLVGFALVRLSGAEARRFVGGVLAIIFVVWAGRYAISVSRWLRPEPSVSRDSATRSDRWPLEVADALRRVGARPGARVAFVGKSPHFYWARLAGVRIVAELRDGSMVPGIPETDQVSPFWLRDEASRLRVVDAFRRDGVDVVVTDAHPDQGPWEPLGRSGLFARMLEGVPNGGSGGHQRSE